MTAEGAAKEPGDRRAQCLARPRGARESGATPTVRLQNTFLLRILLPSIKMRRAAAVGLAVLVIECVAARAVTRDCCAHRVTAQRR